MHSKAPSDCRATCGTTGRAVGREHHTHGETGSGSVLGVALLGATLGMAVLMVPASFVFAARQSVSAAADAAALAAADARIGVVAEFPCPLASRVAAANGATLTDCRLDGLIVTVAVSRPIWGLEVTATATAGPPP